MQDINEKLKETNNQLQREIDLLIRIRDTESALTLIANDENRLVLDHLYCKGLIDYDEERDSLGNLINFRYSLRLRGKDVREKLLNFSMEERIIQYKRILAYFDENFSKKLT